MLFFVVKSLLRLKCRIMSYIVLDKISSFFVSSDFVSPLENFCMENNATRILWFQI